MLNKSKSNIFKAQLALIKYRFNSNEIFIIQHKMKFLQSEQKYFCTKANFIQ